MGKGLLAAGGLLSALAASTCCVLPISLTAVGLGGAWLSTLDAVSTYEMAFRVVGILLLAAGFWLVYAPPKLDFGQFGRCAGERILQGKRIRQGILSLSRLGRDSEEIDPPHILRLEPSLTHSIFGQSQAKTTAPAIACATAPSQRVTKTALWAGAAVMAVVLAMRVWMPMPPMT